jgi:hypothetical protein
MRVDKSYLGGKQGSFSYDLCNDSSISKLTVVLQFILERERTRAWTGGLGADMTNNVQVMALCCCED